MCFREGIRQKNSLQKGGLNGGNCEDFGKEKNRKEDTKVAYCHLSPKILLIFLIISTW